MARIEEVVAATEKEIAQVRTEKAALETLLYKVRSAHYGRNLQYLNIISCRGGHFFLDKLYPIRNVV